MSILSVRDWWYYPSAVEHPRWMSKNDPYFAFQLAVLVAIWRHPFSGKIIAKTIVLPLMLAILCSIGWIIQLFLKLCAHLGRWIRRLVFGGHFTKRGRKIGIWKEGTFAVRLVTRNEERTWMICDARAFHPGQGKLLEGINDFLLAEARLAEIDSLTLKVQFWKKRLIRRYEDQGFEFEKGRWFLKYRAKI